MLARKVLSACDKHSPVVTELEGEVIELEVNISSMDPTEVARVAGNLTSKIKVSTHDVLEDEWVTFC